MVENCRQCGAKLLPGQTCQEIHDSFLIFENVNMISHRVHFLMVTCFLIQHNRYSDEALTWARSMLRAHLDEQVTDQQLLYQLTRGQKGGTRTWKFGRPADAPPLNTVWHMTIADVARTLRDAEGYCEQVKRWAHLTLQQMDSWL